MSGRRPDKGLRQLRQLARLDLCRRRSPQLLTRTLLPVTVIGVAVFLGIAANAVAVMELWAGEATALGTGVLILYAIVFTLIAPAHLMTLMLIARGQHTVIGAVVFAESIVNPQAQTASRS